jgi:hypothetical protein
VNDQSAYMQMMATVSEWEAYAQSPPKVDPASELGAEVLAGYSEVALIAWHGIAVAVDHLLLIRDAGPTEPPCRVLSVPTTCRGALLAGCRTVWILSDSGAGVRRSRALRIQAQEAREEQKAIKEFVSALPDDPEVATAMHESIEAVELTTRRCREAGVSPHRVVDSEVIAQAAKYLAERSGRESIKGALMTSWRTLSGYAHGYQWTGKPALDKPSRADVESAVAAGLLATGNAIDMFKASVTLG